MIDKSTEVILRQILESLDIYFDLDNDNPALEAKSLARSREQILAILNNETYHPEKTLDMMNRLKREADADAKVASAYEKAHTNEVLAEESNLGFHDFPENPKVNDDKPEPR